MEDEQKKGGTRRLRTDADDLGDTPTTQGGTFSIKVIDAGLYTQKKATKRVTQPTKGCMRVKRAWKQQGKRP